MIRSSLMRVFFLILLFMPSATMAQGITNRAMASSPSLRNKTIYRLLPRGDSGLAYVSYAFNPSSDFKDPAFDSLSYHDFESGATIPIPFNDNLLGVGIRYGLTHFGIGDITDYLPRDSLDLHRLALPVDLLFTFGDHWSLNVNFTPRLHTDFVSLDWDDVQFTTHVAAAWAFSKSAALLFGLGLSNGTTNYIPVPALGIVIAPKDSFFRFEAILPAYVKADFQVADPLTLFLMGEVISRRWDIEGEGTVPDHFMEFSEIRAGGGARYKISEGINLQVYGGLDPYRKMEFTNNAGIEVERTPKMGGFIESTLTITPAIFKKDKKKAVSTSY